ncbi:MAG: hypothetical protein COU69_02575 [Candidatus Pacebacteria bacterium CG10_big_fil_rev_8_21_14_0_10_56_10]|nr:MAG: hypothetical protein COU69_02575 [Candidatus Pacebacteria bacterium CG10_big_fil_rev_8_21_14_0_10_56_10]
MDISNYLERISQHCGLNSGDVLVDLSQDDDSGTVMVSLRVPEEDTGLFIGHRGETLSALQRLVRLSFSDDYPDHKITLDINNYRQERADQLIGRLDEVVAAVIESGQPYTFSYLTPYERYVVHSHITQHPEYDQVESISEGQGSYRRLSIQLKE